MGMAFKSILMIIIRVIFWSGEFYLKNGDIYKRQWSDNNENGNALYLFAIGGNYTDEFRNNVPHGKGIQIWSNGDRFEGTWINGKQEGYGIMHYLKSNSKYKQLFKNGNYVSGERIKWNYYISFFFST